MNRPGPALLEASGAIAVVLLFFAAGCEPKRVSPGAVDNTPKPKLSSSVTPNSTASAAATVFSTSSANTEAPAHAGLAPRPGCDLVEQPTDTCEALTRLLVALNTSFRGMRCESSPDLVGKGKVKIGELGDLALFIADFRPMRDKRLEYKTHGACRFAISTEPTVSPVDTQFTCDYSFKFDDRAAEFARQFRIVDHCLGAGWTHDNDAASQRAGNASWETKSTGHQRQRCTLKSDDMEPAAGTLYSGSIVLSCGREWPNDLPADAGAPRR